MIELSGVTKRFGATIALQDVNLSIRRGEIVGLLGPNGAGKTTLMRLLTGFLPPTTGVIRVAGHDVQDEPLAARRSIGYLPETVPVYTELTVHDYLGFIADLRDVPAADRAARIGRAMAQVDIQGVSHRVIGHLSKGYRQRVGLAQALLHDPDLLILDEPTVGLDPSQMIEIRALIRELARGHTVILSSHILPEVSQICTRIVVIARGRIIAQDSQAELEQRLKGQERVVALLKGPRDEVLAAARGLAGVRDARVTDAPDGAVELTVETEVGRDIREELSLLAGQRRWAILSLTRQGLSLEEMFLKLTGGAA